MRKPILLSLPIVAVTAGVAVSAGSVQVVRDRSGDATGPQNPDVVKATARTVGDKQVIVFTTKHAFTTYAAPTLYIQQAGSQNPWQIGGQSHGVFLGQRGEAPRATVTRPSSRSIRYSFKPKDLKLKQRYRWYGTTGVMGHLDRIPDKGWTTTQIG